MSNYKMNIEKEQPLDMVRVERFFRAIFGYPDIMKYHRVELVGIWKGLYEIWVVVDGKREVYIVPKEKFPGHKMTKQIFLSEEELRWYRKMSI